VRQGAIRFQPGEHPVDHAEQEHGQGLGQAGRVEFGSQVGDCACEGGNDQPFLRQHAGLVFGIQEFHVLGQDAMRVLGVGILGDDAVDQLFETLARWLRERRQFLDQKLQSADVAVGNAHEQAVFVPEVVIQGRLGQPAGVGDLVHRGGGIALTREQLRGLIEDRLPLPVVARCSAACHLPPLLRGGSPGGGHLRPPAVDLIIYRTVGQ